jgi:hypothetical protein
MNLSEKDKLKIEIVLETLALLLIGWFVGGLFR